MKGKKDLISNSILDYINSPQTVGALQIDGPWGCGKTYYIKNEIFPKIRQNELEREKLGFNHKRTPLMVSLFGLKEIKDISLELLFAFTSKYGLSKKRLTTLKSIVANISNCIPYLKNIDWNKVLTVSPSSLLKHLGDDIIVFLDDLERISDSIKTEDILGFINDLIENNNFKIILISNQSMFNEEDKDKISKFKEKVVDKTIPFEIDSFSIIKEIAQVYHPLLPTFLEAEEIRGYLDNSKKEQTNNSLSNLRTIRFALNQFGQIFNYFVKEKEYGEIPEDTLSKLFIIWRFTLAISIEFRLGNISLDKPNNLEHAGMQFRFEHLKLNDDIDYKDEEKKEERFEERFIDLYYEKFGLSYLYIPEVYDYILKGGKIDFEKIDKIVSKELGIWKDDDISEELSFVNKFHNRICYLSDEEAATQFLKYMKLISQGFAEKISDFIYAASIMMTFQEVANLTDEDIIRHVKKGIDIFISNIDPNSIVNHKQELEMYCCDIKGNSKSCLQYALDSIEGIMKKQEKEYIDSLNELFISDLKSFSQQCLPHQFAPNVYQPTSPFLHMLDLGKIEERIKVISPWECEELRNLLLYRYGDGRLKYLATEKPFIKSIKNGLDSMNEEDNSLSAHFKRNRLLPYVNKLLEE